jgi:hypothetical protein
MALAFEQQRKESDKAFAAFSMYLSLGPARSLAKTAAKLARSKVLMERWSSKFDWLGRVAAYNEHMALVEREAAEAAKRESGVDLAKMEGRVKQRAWREAEDLIALAEEFKKRWRGTSRVPPAESMVRVMELGFRLMAFAVGVPMDVRQVNTTVGGTDGGPIRVEAVAALKKIYGKPLPGEVVDVEAEPVKPALPAGAPCGGPSA